MLSKVMIMSVWFDFYGRL